MAGLDPAIHVFFLFLLGLSKDVDARDKPGHDELVDLFHGVRCRHARDLRPNVNLTSR